MRDMGMDKLLIHTKMSVFMGALRPRNQWPHKSLMACFLPVMRMEIGFSC